VRLHRLRLRRPLISQTAGQVIWSDFRDYTGVYDSPVPDQQPPADAGSRLPLPDAVFDAAQYLAEVDRATTDRWWETPPLLAARLTRRRLDADRSRLAELGWTREYLWPAREPGVYHLCLRDADDNQICLDLTIIAGPAEDQARQLAEVFLRTHTKRQRVRVNFVGDWRVTCGCRCALACQGRVRRWPSGCGAAARSVPAGCWPRGSAGR